MCGVSVLCIAATGGRVGGMGVCVWRPPVGGMGVCVWRPPVGAGAETEAERHSQAKDNAVCVCGPLPYPCHTLAMPLKHLPRKLQNSVQNLDAVFIYSYKLFSEPNKLST